LPPQVSVPEQEPQLSWPPHPSGTVPQLQPLGPQPLVLAAQATAAVWGVHWHVPAEPPAPLQDCPEAQVPQLTVPPQPLEALPQLLVPHAAVWLSGVHPQTPAPVDTLQVFGAVQVPQLIVPPQPSGAVPQLLVPQACCIV
jgi:hypothetical protein